MGFAADSSLVRSYTRCAIVYLSSRGSLNQILHLKIKNQNASLYLIPVISADSEMKVLVDAIDFGD